MSVLLGKLCLGRRPHLSTATITAYVKVIDVPSGGHSAIWDWSHKKWA